MAKNESHFPPRHAQGEGKKTTKNSNKMGLKPD
jgi:hypothetical protein